VVPNFGEPEADWTDEYDWTRYRGSQPYPCPGGWVLDIIEGDGGMWYLYAEIGEDHETDSDVHDAFEPDYEAYNDARGETAFLSSKIVEDNLAERTSTTEYELKVAGEVVFRRVEPDRDDLWSAVAEALQAYCDDESLEGIAPSTGELPEDLKKEQETEQRKAENKGLGEFDD